MNDFEPRRTIAEEAQCARRIAAAQDETVGAAGEPIDEVVEDAAQPGKAFEGSQLEEFVEQKRRRTAAGSLRPAEKCQRRVECGASTGRGAVERRKRRRVGDRA